MVMKICRTGKINDVSIYACEHALLGKACDRTCTHCYMSRGHSKITYALTGEGEPKKGMKAYRGGASQRTHVRSCNSHNFV